MTDLSSGRPPLRALVVDDSAVARQTLSLVLTRAGMAVSTAPDPVVALTRMRAERPDVVVLDLEMPRMDGLTFLRQLMRDAPLPVVICSTSTGPGSTAAIEALSQGAVAVVEKRRMGVADSAEAADLVQAVIAAGSAAVRRAPAVRPAEPVRTLAPAALSAARAPGSLIAIGASTGGTLAIEEILCALRPDTPPMVIVQHMPAGFTRALAARLDRVSPLEVLEATGGEALVPGRVLIAPGDRHLRVRRAGGGLTAEVWDGPPVNRHRPSVDVLFHSVAAAAGPRAVGVLLTGMGEDGADGLLAVRNAGAWTIAQDQATSVVFGMPAEAVRRGAAQQVLPLHRIAAELAPRAAGRRTAMP
ncbi:MAG TPA: chemotaxis response regulator protein-glutamate methylesterase [Longimicrobium sp.]|jgi:two-component system chemotaxis response regulator CheB|uniref:protein-glutamate methylesterase/protein-glutamine glutaminase n=1 Tax=Longimicrobium sp. TaxID=2029185 RepID=UPI002ED9118C